MRTIGPIALSLVLVLAGCSGLPIGTNEQVTVTPADVPPERKTLPPGVTKSGVVNPQTLLDAHKQEAAGEPLTVTVQRQIVSTNDAVLHRINTTYRFSANRTYVYQNRTLHSNTGFHSRISIWKNDTTTYYLSDSNGSITYEIRPRVDIQKSFHKELFEKLKSLGDQSVEMNDSVGVYRVNGSIQTEDGRGVRGNNTTRAGGYLTAHIDDHGFIQRYSYGWQSTHNNTTARDTTVVRFHRDTTEPNRPAWVDDAVTAMKNEMTESQTDE